MKNYIEEVAISGMEGQPMTLTPEKGYIYARAFLAWLHQRSGKSFEEMSISVAQDPRLSGRLLKIACFDALVPYGVTCLDLHLAASPVMTSSLRGDLAEGSARVRCDAAILITSPEGPSHMNGFKFYFGNGPLGSEEYDEILEISKDPHASSVLGSPAYEDRFTTRFGKKVYDTVETDATQLYSQHLCHLIRSDFHASPDDLPLKGLKVVVDASNGTGGFIPRQVLAPLGADISGSQHLVPDGNFFNHPPDPSDRESRHSVSMKTLSTGSHLGLLFNSDLSSFAAFDGKGNEIHSPAEEDDIGAWLLSNLKTLLKKAD